VIANKLREKCGVSVELYRLYRAAETGSIKMRGHGFTFTKIRDQVYSQLAGSIASDIDRLWSDDWDIDTIVLTGGGCRELAEYLQPLINGHVTPVDPVADPRLNNVQGYIKYGKYIWGEAVSELASVDNESESGTTPEMDQEDIEQISENELSEI
jgi:plasmid segregation protein ParM